jgi:V8-like Glu-specific endopeptidase
MNAFLDVVGIYGGKKEPDDTNITAIYGTASKIGNTKFITAAHVIVECMKHDSYGILFKYLDEKNYRTKDIENIQIYEDIDIATFECDVPHINKYELEDQKLPLLADVASLGFPYGLESKEKTINLRAFKGYIVGNHYEFSKLDGNPSISELSFHCPRGLSGAPVFSKRNKIAGIVIGNNITEMTIYSEKEKVSENKEHIYEKFEAMHLGVMVRSEFLIKKGYT